VSLAGALLWSATVHRPGAVLGVQVLGRHLSASGPERTKAAKRRLRCLKGTKDLGTKCGGNGNSSSETTLVGYSGADHGGGKETGRSTAACVFMLNGGPTSWASKLQQTVATSTAEAEHVAASAAAQEAVPLRQLLCDLGFEQKEATTIYL